MLEKEDFFPEALLIACFPVSDFGFCQRAACRRGDASTSKTVSLAGIAACSHGTLILILVAFPSTPASSLRLRGKDLHRSIISVVKRKLPRLGGKDKISPWQNLQAVTCLVA